MGIAGSRVAVIGGSIAGCAAAIALARAGCGVEVYERSEHALRDRGQGMLLPIPLRDELMAAAYLPQDYPAFPMNRRWWVFADGTESGRVLWEQPAAALTINWGVLWRSLRAAVPDETYHGGRTLRSFAETGDGVEVVLADGTRDRFDVLVGADGYRSVVRPHVHPGSVPQYAGYILWRGTCPESRVVNRASLDRVADAMHTVVFDGGHSIVYLIPGTNERRINWAIYTSPPPGLDLTTPTSIAPGQVTAALYSHLDCVLSKHFPPEMAALVRLNTRDEVSIQPIYDEVVDAYASGRVALIGDAGTVTRPHTGSGATKALQDALALERAACAGADWDSALRDYGAQRVGAGNAIVELGRRLGHAQVTRTPAWEQMSADDFPAWIAATLAGDNLYWWTERPAPEPA